MQKIRENQSEAEKEESNEKSRLQMLDFLCRREKSEEKDLRLEKDRERKKKEAEGQKMKKRTLGTSKKLE